MLCDVEVAGDGTAPFPQDEANVDGAPGGAVPDSNDDGGQGGACHVRSYVHEAYNSPGCWESTAWAKDYADSAADITGGPFIGAACDWKTIYGGTPSSDSFLLCVLNSVLQGQVLNIVDCLQTFLACALSPTGDCTSGGNEACGGDGVPDGINYGHGANGLGYPVYPPGWRKGKFPYLDFDRDGYGDGACLQTDASSQVYVFDAVGLDSAGLPHVHPATSGEIWHGT